MNDLKFVIEIIVIIISVAGSIIALMTHIDRKIDTMRNEIKEDNREIRKYIFDSKKIKMTLFHLDRFFCMSTGLLGTLDLS